jgi:hypothetical protein
MNIKASAKLSFVLLMFFACESDNEVSVPMCEGLHETYETSFYAKGENINATNSWNGWIWVNDSTGNVIEDKELFINETSNLLIEAPCQERFDLSWFKVNSVADTSLYAHIHTLVNVDGAQSFIYPKAFFKSYKFKGVEIINTPDDISEVIIPNTLLDVEEYIEIYEDRVVILPNVSLGFFDIHQALILMKRESESFYRGILIPTDVNEDITIDYSNANFICEEKKVIFPYSNNWKFTISAVLNSSDKIILKTGFDQDVTGYFDTLTVQVPTGVDIEGFLIETSYTGVNPAISMEKYAEQLPVSLELIPSNLESTVIGDKLILNQASNLSYINAIWTFLTPDNKFRLSWEVTIDPLQVHEYELPKLPSALVENFPELESVEFLGEVQVYAIQLLDGSDYEDVYSKFWQDASSRDPFWRQKKGAIKEYWRIK